MKLRLSRPASRDLEIIYEYIARESPRAARNVVERIASVLDMLEEHPRLGRPGRVQGTREAVVTRTGYVAVYRVDGDEIAVARIVHGRQQWPPVDKQG